MDLKKRIAAAQGKQPCDVIFKNATYLDVFSCQWRQGDVAIADGVVVGIDQGLHSPRSIDASGKWLVPGFIDAHVHIESSLLIPSHFQNAVLSRGTTSAVCDPHELANVQGVSGIRYFLDRADQLAIDLWVMMSSCVPATHLETNGGGTIGAEALSKLLPARKALGLAEMMNMPGVLNADPEILEKLRRFQGRPIDGHAPLLRGNALSAYATAGITSCHESSELSEAEEKLRKGISVWIREGSVARDLETLIPLLNIKTSTSIGFCTDDRNPLDILTEGHIDHLLRKTIRNEHVDSEVVYRSASWSVARHYGLDRVRPGFDRIGAIAPGYQADLVLLADEKTVTIERVLKSGRFTDEIEPASENAGSFANSIRAHAPELAELEAPKGSVHVIRVMEGKIITGREVLPHDAKGVAKLSVLERYGHGLKPANGYVIGFGAELRGAIASSVGHDSHNLIAVGDRADDMRTAMSSLIEVGGGFCVVRDGQVLARLALPLGGLMSSQDPAALKNTLLELKKASRAIGCELQEPFLQLAFLSLPVIPSLKLTDRGLVDVDQFKIIDVRAS